MFKRLRTAWIALTNPNIENVIEAGMNICRVAWDERPTEGTISVTFTDGTTKKIRYTAVRAD